MATKLQDIAAVNWQLSNKQIGEVSEGIADIRQCLQTIITTTKGSDPLRPEFGSDIYKQIDKPVNRAAPNIAAEILDCVAKWEQRVIIKSLTYEIIGAQINYEMHAMLLESGQVTQILFYIDRQNLINPPRDGRAFSNGFSFGFS